MKKQDFDLSPSTPTLIKVDGQDQLATVLADHVVGLNPDNGELLWKHPHQCDWGIEHHAANLRAGQHSVHLFGVQRR